MNKNLKGVLITINLVMLFLAVYWYTEKGETEPLITIFGQIVALIVLLSEKKISRIKTKKIHNKSDVDVDVISGDEVNTSDVNQSKVNIKTSK